MQLDTPHTIFLFVVVLFRYAEQKVYRKGTLFFRQLGIW